MPPLPEVAEKMSPSWTHCWQGVSVVVWSPEGTLDPWDKRKRGVGRPETLVFLRHPFFETLWDIFISARLLNTTDGGCNSVLGGFSFYYFLLIGVTNEKNEIWGHTQPEKKKKIQKCLNWCGKKGIKVGWWVKKKIFSFFVGLREKKKAFKLLGTFSCWLPKLKRRKKSSAIFWRGGGASYPYPGIPTKGQEDGFKPINQSKTLPMELKRGY